MNMSVENNILHLLCQTKRPKPMLVRFFFLNFFKITYIICNPVFKINKPESQPKTAVSHNVNAHQLTELGTHLPN